MGYFGKLRLIWRRAMEIAKNPKAALRTAWILFRRTGIRGLIEAIKFVIQTSHSGEHPGVGRHDFPAWFGYWQSQYTAPRIEHGSKISVVMPVYNTQINHLISAVESVISQTYENWELCIADDASTDKRVIDYLSGLQGADPRIKVTFRQENGHISAASNSAIELVSGSHIGFLDHDDILMPWALSEVASQLKATPDAKYIYSDEMRIDAKGQPLTSHFKSNLNRELARAMNYFCHFSVYETKLLKGLGGLRRGFEGSQDYDLSLRVMDALEDSEVAHIPMILYGWRAIEGSTALRFDAKPYAFEAGRKALEEHLIRSGIDGRVEGNADLEGAYRVRYDLRGLPLVTVIIPTRNQVKLLKKCVQTLLDKTSYSNIEVIVVDNGSDEPDALKYLETLRESGIRVLVVDEPFNFSRLNNLAAAESSGEYLCLLNNDIEITKADWLGEMVSVAQRPEVGAVGAKLSFPDGTIQHAGVILGIGGVAGHSFRTFPAFSAGYAGRASCGQEVSAVTAACLVVEKGKYLLVGGLTEDLAVGYNDVDFCLKLQQSGFHNVFWPFAKLIHHESKSRGDDVTPEQMVRAAQETLFMRDHWQEALAKDPFYNPNLSRKHDDFSLNWALIKNMTAAEVAAGAKK
jgi:glycosyltransferase involved in cell wall biosynthesis